MANYGFVIDLTKCIGCHACTIACKAEHDVPIGVNRCWVKTVEQGTFPDTERLFFPVLCNQCDAAPCIAICPTRALYKRRDGIVDLNGDSCIGCRACMEACPYDQLFIDPDTHTAEKCNFCANRVENELLPACVSVCPTQCRVFGDLDDPASHVSSLLQIGPTTVRKPEKKTLPKILYIGAEESLLRPEIAARGRSFKEGEMILRPPGARAEDPRRPGAPRVDYDVPHKRPWGTHLVIYLVAKGISAGSMFLSVALWCLGQRGTVTELAGPGIALVFAAITALVLVLDLERPERFYYILTRSNWGSWLVRGTYFLMGHGLVAGLWIGGAALGWHRLLWGLALPGLVLSVLATIYTSFLFAQGLGRDLWQSRYSAPGLAAQAAAAGAASLLLAAPLAGAPSADLVRFLGRVLFASIAVHLGLLAVEHLVVSSPSPHHELAVGTIVRGPFARAFWGLAVLAGGLVPLALIPLASPGGAFAAPLLAVSAILTLGGALAWDYIWVEAGQSVPLS